MRIIVGQRRWALERLRNDDGDSNENGKKAIGLDKQNNNFARASRFFVHFSAVDARLTWNCPISRFVEDGNRGQQFSFSFPELWCSPLEFNSQKYANIWRIKREGISTVKFEAEQIHFLSDVFVAVGVAVVVA